MVEGNEPRFFFRFVSLFVLGVFLFSNCSLTQFPTEPSSIQKPHILTVTLIGRVIVPSMALFSSGLTTQSEKDEQALSRDFVVQAYDRQEQIYGPVNLDENGIYRIPGTPMGVRMRVQSMSVTHPNLVLTALVETSENQQETVQDITVQTTAIATIVKEAEKQGNTQIQLEKLETGSELTPLIEKVKNKIVDTLGKSQKLDKPLDEIQEIKEEAQQASKVIQKLTQQKNNLPDTPHPTPLDKPTPTVSSLPSPSVSPKVTSSPPFKSTPRPQEPPICRRSSKLPPCLKHP